MDLLKMQTDPVNGDDDLAKKKNTPPVLSVLLIIIRYKTEFWAGKLFSLQGSGLGTRENTLYIQCISSQ